MDRTGRRWVPAVLRDAGEDDADGYVVGVRETTDDDSWSLLLMECYDPTDKQEISLGMDTYCLVVDPGQATHYGGVRGCEVTDQHLRLLLTEGAATTLGMPADVTFALALPAGQLPMLRRGLTRVLSSGRADAVPQHLLA